jgi:hypothetical protein
MTNIVKQQSNQNQLTLANLPSEFQVALSNLPSTERKLAELNLSTKKIAKFDKSDYQKLYLYLVGLSKVSGIKEPPDKDVLMTITGFLKENFYDFSQEEIEKSFNMAFAHKLPDLKNEDIQNYGVLTPIWFGKILNSYKTLRSKELIRFNTEFQRLEREKQREISEIESDKIMANSILVHYEKFVQENIVVDFGNSMYNWLTKKAILNLNVETKHKLLNEAKKNLMDKSLDKSNTNPFDRVVSSMKNGMPEDVAKSEAMTLGVKYFFKDIKENKTDFKLLLKKYL